MFIYIPIISQIRLTINLMSYFFSLIYKHFNYSLFSSAPRLSQQWPLPALGHARCWEGSPVADPRVRLLAEQTRRAEG